MNNLAFVFPGQGSQKVGMLAELAAEHSVVTETFSEASDALGFDLWKMVQEGPQETLNLTEHTQPMLLTASIACWRVWEQTCEARPTLLAGHSLGEFSALVCAGVIDFTDAVNLVRNRGRYMQTAVPVGVGAMAAIIGLDDDVIREACEASAGNEVVSAVNFNAPGQVVIAGHAEAVERAMEACKAAGAKRALPLPVSAPFHTSLMKPAGEQLAVDIEALTFNAPKIPVVHNVHAKTESDPEVIKRLMVEQIYSPVRWVECVKTMVGQGAGIVVECGAGKVLGGLNKRIDGNLVCLATEAPVDMTKAKEALAGQ